MWDVGCGMRDVGCRMQDAGCGMRDAPSKNEERCGIKTFRWDWIGPSRLACEKCRHTKRSRRLRVLSLDQQTSRRRKEEWLVFFTFKLLVSAMSYLVVANGGEYLFGVCSTLCVGGP